MFIKRIEQNWQVTKFRNPYLSKFLTNLTTILNCFFFNFHKIENQEFPNLVIYSFHFSGHIYSKSGDRKWKPFTTTK